MPAALVKPVFVNGYSSYHIEPNGLVLRNGSVYAGCGNVAISSRVVLSWPIGGYCFVAISNFVVKSRGRDVTYESTAPLVSTKRVCVMPSAFAFAFIALINALPTPG